MKAPAGFWDQFGTKLISVAIAIVLWFVVLGSRNVEETKEVPIEIMTSSDLVASNAVVDRVAFRLSGPKAFLRAVLDRREEPIRVNLTGAKAGLVTYRFFSDNIRLPIGVKVQSIQPTAILVKLEPVKRKEVPVRLELRGVPPEGYRLTRAEISPNRVNIRGPESKVDALQELVALPVDLNTLRGEMAKDANFDLSRFQIALDGEVPRVEVVVEPVSANYKIKNLEVRAVGGRGRIEPAVATLLVRATQADLGRLDRARVSLIVDLAGKGKGKHTLPIKVSLPEGIGLVKVVPANVTVTVTD